MFHSDCIVLKLCVVFLQMITMAKQATMLFDFHNMAFKNFWLEVANKKPLSTLNLPLHKKFPVKKAYFLRLQNFVSQATTLRIFCLLCQKMNASKIMWNCSLTFQLEIFKIIYNLPKIARQKVWVWYDGRLTLYNLFIYALIYALIYWCTCIKERKASLYFLY